MDDVHDQNAKLRELKALMLELERFFNSRGMLYWLDQETGELMYQDVNEPSAKPPQKNWEEYRRMEKAWRMRHLGTIEAAGSAKKAIEEAIKKFNIEPAPRKRITVAKISKRDDD